MCQTNRRRAAPHGVHALQLQVDHRLVASPFIYADDTREFDMVGGPAAAVWWVWWLRGVC
jgi:hypothetical protein